MDSSTQITEVTKSIRGVIQQKLRSEYPFMKPEALQRALDNVTDSIKTDVALEDSAMTEAKARFSFLSLPAEIRNEIYSLVVVRSRPMRATLWADWFSGDGVPFWSHTLASGLALASHQVQAEASAAHYGQNSFVIFITAANPDIRFEQLQGAMEKKVQPYGKLFRKLSIQFQNASPIALGNYIWLKYHCNGTSSTAGLCYGPVPLLTPEMVASVFGFQRFGLSRAVVTVACFSHRRGIQQVAVVDMPKVMAG
ncbi:hypothetical protein PRZ48_010818 [Zasmidium cellare]|uniref:Uncharacterized protein n=1 Tax=Zasmidium cellare TaxID=395010 RepID=A0ABR0E9R8_ZASCE|nr:hypothetical protein PRZ48_010818 [Zasmidium cellare]